MTIIYSTIAYIGANPPCVIAVDVSTAQKDTSKCLNIPNNYSDIL
jgi:hypothetical protein